MYQIVNRVCVKFLLGYFLGVLLLLTAGLLQGQQRLTSRARAPIALWPELSVSFFENLSYGADSLHTFDLFVPNASQPLPLVLFIHGGGFEGGDKSELYGQETGVALINALLSEGIAFASINYRLLAVGDTTGVLKSLHDARRCLQYIRHNAAYFNIDKERVALYGTSAGAGTSLWIGLQEDMKDETSADPTAHESTRVSAIAVFATQATYDLLDWNEVFRRERFKTKHLYALVGADRIAAFYGCRLPVSLKAPAVARYREQVDMLAMLSADDPPLWIDNPLPARGLPRDQDALFHHYRHGQALLRRATELGSPCLARLPAARYTSPGWLELAAFFQKYLH